MKRYRVVQFDFDTRATILSLEPGPAWEPKVVENHKANQESIREGLLQQFGPIAGERKIENYTELGPKPFSVLAFHNRFFSQIRDAFVVGSYYPALTGACALGERILNHLIRSLRDEFQHTPEYRKVYRKDSFDNWPLAISTLDAWEVLLPDAHEAFGELIGVRNRALHFNPDTDTNDRALALEAIELIRRIIVAQFAAMGPRPWFIPGSRGETFIAKEWESKPFVKVVYLPNCLHVGPEHRCVQVQPFKVSDVEYPDVEVSDAEFLELREKAAAEHAERIRQKKGGTAENSKPTPETNAPCEADQEPQSIAPLERRMELS